MARRGSGAAPADPWRVGHRLPLALVAFLLLVPLLAAVTRDTRALSPTFGPNRLVDNSPAPVESARIAADGGVLHVAWRDSRGGNWNAYYSRSLDDGATWSPGVRVDTAPAGSDVWEMDLAAGGGTVVVVWTDARTGDQNVYSRVSRNAGVTWDPAVRVDDAPLGIEAFRPVVALDGAGAAHVAWEDWRNATAPWQVFHARSADQGVTWSANDQVSATVVPRMATAPSIAATGSGEVHVAYRDSGSGAETIYVANSFDSGATWSRVAAASASASQPLFAPDVAVGAGGRVGLTWIHQGLVRVVRYASSPDAGATWSLGIRVDDVPTGYAEAYPDEPTLAFSLGRPYVVWHDMRSTLRDLYASGSSDGGASWGDCPAPCWPNNDARVDDSVATDYQLRPSAAAWGATVYAVWEDNRTGMMNIYFARHVAFSALISEFRDGAAGEEAVELAAYRAINFAGWTLVVDGTPYSLGPLGAVPAGGLRTVGNWATADLLIPSFTLGDAYANEGGGIELRDAANALVDQVRFGQLGPPPDGLNGASVSRYFDGTVHLDEWTHDVTPTLGAANDAGRVVAPAVILNEVLYDAANPATRFVELLLRGPAPVNTTGYHLVGDTVYTIPATAAETLTPSNPEGQVVEGAAPLVFGSLRTSGDNLYLYDPAWNLLDEVGWSSAHPPDTSLCRSPSGAGTFAAFDDASALAGGWRFGCVPSPPQIGLGPTPQVGRGDLGDTVRFTLTITNKQAVPDAIDLTAAGAPGGWAVAFYNAADTAPLLDGADPGADPDTGTLATDQSVDVTVRVAIPAASPPQDSESVTVTAEAGASAATTTASLRVDLNPYLEVNRWADPTTINVLGTGINEQTAITVELRGRGTPIPSNVTDQADIAFVIDDAQKMDPWIAQFKAGINETVRRLQENITDLQLALVSFEDIPYVDMDVDLTPSMAGFQTAVGMLVAQEQGGELPGPRNPDDADAGLEVAANVSWRPPTAQGTPTRLLVLLGMREARDNDHLLSVASWARQALGARTSALALGIDPITSSWFSQTAAAGEGYFEEVPTTARLTDALLESIVRFIPPVSRAGGDPDPTDGEPMVRDVLPAYLVADTASAVDPATGAARPPSYVGTDASGDTVLEWNVSTVRSDTNWTVRYLAASTLPGVLNTNLPALSRVRFQDWKNATITIPLPPAPVTVLGAFQPPRTRVSWDPGAGVRVLWEPPPILPHHFLVYRATGDPRAFAGFDPAAAVARVDWPAMSWTDPLPLTAAGERYYVVRSANAAETALSPTGNTAGVVALDLPPGPTTVSRPLDYFPWVDYSGPEPDTIGEYRAAFGAARIDYLENGAWRTVPGGGDPDRAVALGEAMVVLRFSPGLAVFAGLPGSMILHSGAGGFGGYDPASDAAGLTARVAGDDVALEFPAAAGMSAGVDAYEVWAADSRAGFFDGTSWQVPGSPFLAAAGPMSVTHAGAITGPGEACYLVVPRLSTGETGTSTYSVCVWTTTYLGTQFVGLPLRPLQPGPVSWYVGDIPAALGIAWLAPPGIWVAHAAGMGPGVYDATFRFGGGVQLSVGGVVPVRYSYVGS